VSSARLAASSPIAPGPANAQSSRVGPASVTIRFSGHTSWWHSVRGNRSAAASRSERRSHMMRSVVRNAAGQARTAAGWSQSGSPAGAEAVV
jgi:hypothetical protein